MRKTTLGLMGGFAVLLFTLTIPSPWSAMSQPAWHTAGLASMMAIWWVTEAIPVSVTAFAPLLFAPLIGLENIKTVSAYYAHPLIYLFLGGFILSLAMEKSNLHRRIALVTMKLVGTKPRNQVGGLMLITAFLSMWMSNTATAVMMLPIALSIIELLKKEQDVSTLAPALLLGIAYSASVGGMATLIGTPPNALLAAYLSDTYGIELGFGQWMAFALPFTLIMLVVCWLWLTAKQMNVQGSEHTMVLFRERLLAMGRMKPVEKRVLIVFIGAASCWILRKPLATLTGLPLSDTGIAMAASILLFILPGSKPGEPILNWSNTTRLPWGVLVLFGGGLALAGLIRTSGLADHIAALFGDIQTVNKVVIIGTVALSIVFLTEITSNTATTAGFLPLLGPIAESFGANPAMLVIPAAMAASAAFMMPVATPPNAIIFASGELKIEQMAKAGLVLNFVSAALITCFAVWLVPRFFL